MATTRSKSYILVPVEIETMPDLDEPGKLHVGSIKMPSEMDIRRSMDAHSKGKVVTCFTSLQDAWKELFHNTPEF